MLTYLEDSLSELETAKARSRRSTSM
jgi:hypothetical protein